MGEGMTERPKCKGCGAPSYVIVGSFPFCGECALKIDEKRKQEEETKIKEFLK